MKKLTVDKARLDLENIINEVTNLREPIQIIGNNANTILISEEDWCAIQETMSLLSIPGMRESICEGLQTPISQCSEELKWE